MKKEIKIIILIILVFVLIFTYFYLITEYGFKKKDGGGDEFVDKKEKIVKDDGIDRERYKKEDLPDIKAQAIEAKARKMLCDFDFIGAEKHIANEMSGYKIKDTPENKKLKLLINEIATMGSLPAMRERGENREVREIIRGLKDPENFFIATIWLDANERLYLIKSTDSLNPFFINDENTALKVDVLEKNEGTAKDFPRIPSVEKDIPNIKNITEIKFEAEGNDLIAYIVEDEKGLHFYKMIEEVEGSTIYFTIEEWDAFQRKINKNLKKDNNSLREEDNQEEYDLPNDETREGGEGNIG